MKKFYVASKAKHGEMWKNWRLRGVPMTSRWIDKWDEGTFPKEQQTSFWNSILEDIESCDALVLYAEEGEVQKGSLAEWGMAFSLGKELYYVGPKGKGVLTALDHERVVHCPSLEDVFKEFDI